MSKFQQKPGTWSLFKNDQKEHEEDRDFKGSLVLPDGAELWISGWKRKTKNGGTYLGGTVKPKSETRKPSDAKSLRDELDDEIPI